MNEIRTPVLLAAVGILGYAAWVLTRQQAEDEVAVGTGSGGGGLLGSADDLLTDTAETAAQAVDSWTGGMLKLSAMSKVSRADLDNKNVRAMLMVIRTGEGTADPDGYRRVFGGGTFTSFADHPRIAVKKWGLTSTAAGAYQALTKSWDETARIMGLQDFSPGNQDMFAIGRIAARGALADVKAGNLEAAISKLNKEWASLPDSPYGQKTLSWERARAVFASNGGNLGDVA